MINIHVDTAFERGMVSDIFMAAQAEMDWIDDINPRNVRMSVVETGESDVLLPWLNDDDDDYDEDEDEEEDEDE